MHRISGRFSKVWFENGDSVEAVVERQGDGTYLAYAIRRSSDNTLWMFPHFWAQGHRAYRRVAVKASLVTSAICVVWYLVTSIMKHFGLVSTDWFGVVWGYAVGFAVFMLFVPSDLPIGRKWKLVASKSEVVFGALGYVDPSNIDMKQQDSRYWKTLAKPGEQRNFAPWVYRYVDSR
jgi:hypothetical protein